jgi:hypothetical protein
VAPLPQPPRPRPTRPRRCPPLHRQGKRRLVAPLPRPPRPRPTKRNEKSEAPKPSPRRVAGKPRMPLPPMDPGPEVPEARDHNFGPQAKVR